MTSKNWFILNLIWFVILVWVIHLFFAPDTAQGKVPMPDFSYDPGALSQPVVIKNTMQEYADEYGLDYSTMLAVADCESSLNPYAANSVSSAKGLYQWTDKSWKWIKAPGHQFDLRENIHQFAIWFPLHPEWWDESKSCWSKRL